MTEGHRALPAWMAKWEEKVKEKEPLRSCRKRKAARSVFYCMNEKELVEAAVSLLTNEDVVISTHQQVEEKAEHTPKKSQKLASPQLPAEPVTEEESSDCADDLETTYISETDLDITEVETLPYTKSPLHHGSEGQRSSSVNNFGRPVQGDVEAEKRKQQPRTSQEDDALQLVREIFFN